MVYRTVLVDDEPLALKRLERMLGGYRETIEIVGRAESGADAVALINEARPDLIFLDIQMPELTGFDVLEYLDYTPLVIFSTAYDEYALKAFEVNSIDYLLKPVDPGRLKRAVEKLLRLSDAAAGDIRERIEKMLAAVPGTGKAADPGTDRRQDQADTRLRNRVLPRQRQVRGSPCARENVPHHTIPLTARIRAPIR